MRIFFPQLVIERCLSQGNSVSVKRRRVAPAIYDDQRERSLFTVQTSPRYVLNYFGVPSNARALVIAQNQIENRVRVRHALRAPIFSDSASQGMSLLLRLTTCPTLFRDGLKR